MSDQLHPAAFSEEQLLADCEIKRTRGSGPGGQHRNKVETAIVITHRPTGTTSHASERRSQLANRSVAVERLRISLAIHCRSDVSATRQPGERWASRTKSGKISVSQSHFDFAALLAEAMDFITSEEFNVSQAAKRLNVSTSQLIRFLKVEPNAFQFVNSQRQKREQHRLK